MGNYIGAADPRVLSGGDIGVRLSRNANNWSAPNKVAMPTAVNGRTAVRQRSATPIPSMQATPMTTVIAISTGEK